ncbi:hypothetical protein PMAYCL1PPCAC_19108 [Pristionchus mayeri]|uniref:Uncharacterized protein n=1 Tax=Pristionchus mayeri TaxID=1317129 RepID=A0AAN5I204_9BILA|nr:hypothetical protein PMAYCL1PPCAC_19108 [Pristionchus mayeri]
MDSRMSSLTIPDYGLKTNDVKYFSMESVVRGRGAARLKYLDLEGRWVLSGSSIPYISSAFNHLQRLNDASLPMRDIMDQPMNAIGMIGWTKSSTDAKEEKPEKRSQTLPRRTPLRETQPVVVSKKEVEPRENVPYRSAGYGDAHERRRMSLSSDRSRSASPQKQFYSDRLSPDGDRGYKSGTPSPRQNEFTEEWRPPHRTQTLTSRPSSRVRMYDTEYDDSLVKQTGENRQYSDELRISTKGHSHTAERRHYNISPRSIGSAGESLSGSEQGSPNLRDRNADEVLMMAYHSKKTTEPSRIARRDWIRNY